MSTFDFASLLLVLAVAIGVANEHTLRLPRPVALLLGSLLVLSLIVVADAMSGHAVREHLRERIARGHLPQVLLDGLLALLLFASSLQVDLRGLRNQLCWRWRPAASYSAHSSSPPVCGRALHHPRTAGSARLVPGDRCGAGADRCRGRRGIISAGKLPPGLHETIIGESLFNDGAAVVVFVGGGWKWWGTDGFVGCGSVMLG